MAVIQGGVESAVPVVFQIFNRCRGHEPFPYAQGVETFDQFDQVLLFITLGDMKQ